jgi:hypothetical protein
MGLIAKEIRFAKECHIWFWRVCWQNADAGEDDYDYLGLIVSGPHISPHKA